MNTVAGCVGDHIDTANDDTDNTTVQTTSVSKKP